MILHSDVYLYGLRFDNECGNILRLPEEVHSESIAQMATTVSRDPTNITQDKYQVVLAAEHKISYVYTFLKSLRCVGVFDFLVIINSIPTLT